MNLSQNKAYLAALFAVFVWGAFPTVIKGALEFTSVEQLLTLRFAISTLLFIWVMPRAVSKVPKIPIASLLGFVLVGVVVFYSQTYALQEVPASWYVAAFTFVPIIFLAVYREPLNVIGKLGSALAVLGMAVFFISLGHSAAMSVWNVTLVIISMLAWVAYSVFAKNLHPYLKDLELVAFTNLIGFLSSMAIWAMHSFQAQAWSFAGVSLSLLAGILLPAALVAYSFSLRENPVFAMFSQYLEPILGLVVAALLLGERMHLLQYMASLIVIVGTLLVGVATRK